MWQSRSAAGLVYSSFMDSVVEVEDYAAYKDRAESWDVRGFKQWATTAPSKFII